MPVGWLTWVVRVVCVLALLVVAWVQAPRAGAVLRGAWDELRAVGPTRDVDAERAEFGRWLADEMKQSG